MTRNQPRVSHVSPLSLVEHGHTRLYLFVLAGDTERATGEGKDRKLSDAVTGETGGLV